MATLLINEGPTWLLMVSFKIIDCDFLLTFLSFVYDHVLMQILTFFFPFSVKRCFFCQFVFSCFFLISFFGGRVYGSLR